ncbi:MAG: alkane 1-monooxygenase [Immundisolibacteraceae bacterium]|nr:alkane 1-monooxygenase [Immundisolibacteraceae bacterium]
MIGYLRYMLPTVMVTFGILGLVLGSSWCWLGTVVFLCLAAFDPFLGVDHSRRQQSMPRLANIILYFQIIPVFCLWIVFAWRMNAGAETMTLVDFAGATISVAFMTALGGLPAAHEMFHRSSTGGKLVGSLLSTFFASSYASLAHNHIHHIETNTPDDTETPYRGENVYHFVVRAAARQHRESWRIELTRLKRLGLAFWHPTNTILQGLIQYALLQALFFSIAGFQGMLMLMCVSLLGLFILEIFSYLQHYGLVRVPGSPIEKRHAWNHLTPISRALTFEITAHSHHHIDPEVPYYELPPVTDAPQMPSAITCFVAALIPPLWHRYIGRPKIQMWDNEFANAAELELAAEANRNAGWSDSLTPAVT